MEGLAITPDGKTLVGIIQAALIQDANQGKAAKKLLRIEVMDIASGQTIHEFAYGLTDGSGVSEICALNNHEFLVDERDGTGREVNVPPGNSTNAKVKQLFKIDLDGAVDVSAMDGLAAAANPVAKTLFLNLVTTLNESGIDLDQIPSKIEGLAFGPDIREGTTTVHTLWIGNDNDFVQTVNDVNGNAIANPNQIFVFGFTDGDLQGSVFVPQKFSGFHFGW